MKSWSQRTPPRKHLTKLKEAFSPIKIHCCNLLKRYFAPASSLQPKFYKMTCLTGNLISAGTRPFHISLAASLLCYSPISSAKSLTQFSLEELMSIEITSVAKKSQPLSEAASAITVITHEDIRRSGMNSIPELLRLVPGLHVAQIDANNWAVSSRGFNGRFTNKLLVLMDGRSLYTPLFSGVYWNVQDTPLDDIERIEVIRGPGGTVWGANAVNGVINIITQHSRDTTGGQATILAGNQYKTASLRYGSALGKSGWVRAYAKLTNNNEFDDTAAGKANDAWDTQRAGFRADWELSTRDKLTIQGDLYQGNAEQTIGILEDITSGEDFVADTSKLSGGNLMLHWRRTLSDNADWKLQAYFDRYENNDASVDQRIDTYDVDFQHRFPATDRQEITWGIGYRKIEDSIENSFTVSFNPDHRDLDIYSAFIQDEIQLRDDLTLTVGSKFEHNDYTGFEYQPSARLLWKIEQQHSVWSAISRAVRTPSRADNDIRINFAAFSSPFVDPDGPGPLVAGDPTLLSIFGDTDFKSEELLAFEFGYRGQPRSDLNLSASLFYNLYDNLSSNEQSFSIETEPTPTHALIAGTFDNRLEAESYGLELEANWQVSQDFRLYFGYSWLKVDARSDSDSTDVNTVRERENSTPEHQFQVRSRWNINSALDIDLALYYVDNIDVLASTGIESISAYTRFDARLGWNLTKDIELNLVGQNLFDNKHQEFQAADILNTQVPRSIYGQLKLAF